MNVPTAADIEKQTVHIRKTWSEHITVQREGAARRINADIPQYSVAESWNSKISLYNPATDRELLE